MAAYLIADITVHDPDGYKAYASDDARAPAPRAMDARRSPAPSATLTVVHPRQ